ncbi:sn-glycerol-3-phosphate ABC transporter ATP-binding protein UgpC [Terrihabitans rhizophilus]|uniref:Sn-glycerol-3-phosphate ABC transporter ATP-binding protein UgpC n=1 Tax=Terrihabitans rhizophilus TaxID=3092662 RepID=A0ABU4RP87_9HYPH|nr:sn-glycerol-3-phosphate ABC transporter ATP-binding protein UgpC [Terrihabitans sp. PJ23]MDX6805998.1 sn-glycerol-3-phosphate ABC transporter ATP-binding protein UgpC [Terrihabitans sp. PJ23]
MASIELRGVSKAYAGGALAVRDVNLEIADGEFMIFLGPSGCGKSTTLRMIAGLETITSGDLIIDGKRVNDVDPAERDIAIVFQNYALYPHMTVRDNMGFGLKLRGVPKAEIARRIDGIAEMLGVTVLLDRRPAHLSGGQRQRVALGRALVREPRAFLLDEPLSNLDAKLRAVMRTELIKLHRRLGTTMIHVTHDQVEAMTMGQRICIMRDGEVVQVGAPLDVYRDPADTFVASFLATPPMNLLPGRIEAAGDDLVAVAGGVSVRIPAQFRADYLGYAGKPVILGLRPEDLHETEQRAGAAACPIRTRIETVEALGPETVLTLSVTGGQELAARLSAARIYVMGSDLTLYYDAAKLHLFDPATTKRIPRLSAAN